MYEKCHLKCKMLKKDDHSRTFFSNQQLVETMLENFRILGANMSIKVHFLHSHLSHFPENLGDFSEKQGEDFTKILKIWNIDIKVAGMKQ